MNDFVRIRAVSTEDAAAVAELSYQLGYATPVEALTPRIQSISASMDQAAFVACLEDEVVGWIEVSISRHLHNDPYALIGGLVVRDKTRSCGIGKLLCAEAEAWARKQGVKNLRVHSQMKRQDAHRFYLREGFQQIKTSAVFEKELNELNSEK